MNLTYQLPFEMREKLEEEALRLKVEPDTLVLSLLQEFLLTYSSDGMKKTYRRSRMLIASSAGLMVTVEKHQSCR